MVPAGSTNQPYHFHGITSVCYDYFWVLIFNGYFLLNVFFFVAVDERWLTYIYIYIHIILCFFFVLGLNVALDMYKNAYIHV